MKILLVDLEIAPNVVHTWGLFNQFIAINQIVEPSRTLCWAAKWYGEPTMMFDSVYHSTEKQMIKGIYNLMMEADCVVTFNGDQFDLKILNRDFIKIGLTPPQPMASIDLLKVVRKKFRFPSNKLAYVAKELGLGEKVTHEGHDLWVKCMDNDPVAWKTMKKYNEHDVWLLEALYDKVKGWIPNHPNHGLYTESVSPVCRNCGGGSLISRGYRYTKTKVYRRYQCRDPNCGAWTSARLSERREDSGVLA